MQYEVSSHIIRLNSFPEIQYPYEKYITLACPYTINKKT